MINSFFILFLIFLLLFFAIKSVSSQNTIIGVLFLVLLFCSSSLLLLAFGIDYFPLLYIAIYAGALSVVFIFVVMMIKTKTFGKPNFSNVFIFLFFIFLLNLFYFNYIPNQSDLFIRNIPVISHLTNIEVLGILIIKDYSFFLIVTGVILLASMVGSVVLVLEPSINFKKRLQNMLYQTRREFKNSVFLGSSKK